MHRYIQKLFSNVRPRSAKSRSKRMPYRPRLGLEGLETREVPATSLTNLSMTISGTNGNDVIELLSPTATTTEVRVNGVTEFSGAATINRISIDGRGGADQVLIRGVQSGVTGMVNVFAAEDVIVGQANASNQFSTANVRSAVNVFGTVDGNLSIRNDADATAKTVTVTANSVRGLAPVDVLFSMPAGPRTGLSLRTGNGADTININSTIPASAIGLSVTTNGGNDTFNVAGTSTTLRLNGGGANDTFNLAPGSRNLGAIDRLVVVNGGSGTNSLVLNDQNRSMAQTSYDATFGVEPQGGRISIDQLNLQSGQTDSVGVGVIGIQSVRFAAPTATGDAEVFVEATQAGVVTTIDSGGSREVRLGDAGSMSGILGGVTVNRASAGGLLVLDDSAQTRNRTYTLTANSVQRTGSPAVAFDNNTSTVRLQTGRANDSFNANEQRGGTGLFQIVAGQGSDELRGANATNLWDVTGTNRGNLNERLEFSSMEVLQGGSGDDHFRLRNGAAATGAINGNPLVIGNPILNGGFDTIDYSQFLNGVVVDLVGQRATNVGQFTAGRMTGIDAIIGGAGGDTLTGNAGANVIHGSGGNDIIVGGGGRDILIGGAGTDDLASGNFESILVAGNTSSAIATPEAMKALRAEWIRTDANAAQRRAHILNGGGLNDPFRLNSATIVDDAVADIVRAGSATDLIFLHADDLLGGTPQNPNEIVVL